MKGRKWILVKHFEGVPKDSDLQLVEDEEVSSLNDGDVLFEALYWSVDPYMRPYSKNLSIGSVMIGQHLARVTESKNPNYAVGSHYLIAGGWREKTVFNPDASIGALFPKPFAVLDTGSHPISLNLGGLGMPGVSAYIGLIKCCDPKPGETVFVNSAAGVVGSVAGQIAKIKGCRVVGSAGSDEKCQWLTKDLGFDYVFNYKTRNLSEALKEGAPNGIDCFFDNVGDKLSTEIIIEHMNRFGRICNCGAISQYNDNEPPTGTLLFRSFVFKELQMKGFICSTYLNEFPAMLAELKQWVDEGKLKCREDVVEGFENLREAFYGMLSGKYTGKVIVKAVSKS